MTAVEEARDLFARAGLVFPPVPPDLAVRLQRVDEWCYASRDVNPGRMYMFDLYPHEVVAEPVDDYIAVSHAGHGVNSYSINYHLVYGRVALFVQVGWGGAYMDEREQAETIAGWFAKCGAVLEAVAGVGATGSLERGRLVIAQSEIRDVNVFGWLSEPTGDPEAAAQWLTDHNRREMTALDSALASLGERAG